MNKFARRVSLDEEKRIIIEEVSALMGMGYREKDNEQVMEGMQVAIDGCSDHEWRLWVELPLRCVIEDFFALGVP